MFLAPIVRPSKIIFLSTETQDVDLYSQAGAPTYPANILCFISANVTASTPTKPAFRTGTSWTPGTWIYVENTANVVGSIGNTGITGIKGTTGNAGGLGEYGAGGKGGNGSNDYGLAGSGGGTGFTGYTGDTGGTGGTGGNGETGGISFQADAVTGAVIVLNNMSAIIGGAGGIGGTGGEGGDGGIGGPGEIGRAHV